MWLGARAKLILGQIMTCAMEVSFLVAEIMFAFFINVVGARAKTNSIRYAFCARLFILSQQLNH
jgi:hypothetical protein